MENFINTHVVSYKANNETIEKSNFVEKYPNFDFIYDLIASYGGFVFDEGLFKIHTFEYLEKWTNLITCNYFKNELKDEELICFASNWQGCMYCIDSKNNSIIYFDPATCDFFKADGITLNLFFDNILVDGEYDIISEEYFKEAFSYLKSDRLEYGDSFGHKIYLHLGGEDQPENYEIVNTEVLWGLQIQLSDRINEIPS